jgi:hypothetical protein
MALFTDGPAADIADLVAQDTHLLTVASVEGIDVTQKLQLAHDDLSMDLHELLDGRIENVVVTRALKLCHTHRTLEMIYRDAYACQLNDRYQQMRDKFADRARWAYDKLLGSGIALCRYPVPKASVPMVGGTPGDLADGTYYITVAWVNDAGEEGAPATMSAFTTKGSSFLVQPGVPPAGAAGWNVYVGASPEGMSRQNVGALETGANWLQPDGLTSDGCAPGTGQTPTYSKALRRRILRG